MAAKYFIHSPWGRDTRSTLKAAIARADQLAAATHCRVLVTRNGIDRYVAHYSPDVAR